VLETIYLIIVELVIKIPKLEIQPPIEMINFSLETFLILDSENVRIIFIVDLFPLGIS